MRTGNAFGLILLPVLLVPALGASSPKLGQPATAEEIAAFDLTVMPNGEGLPPGSGTAKQGAAVFQQCVACHGPDAAGGPKLADKLVGGQGTLGTPAPVRTVGSYWPYASTLFDFIRRAMPYNTPKSLTDDQVYQVTAYVLFLNGIIAEDAVMNKDTLPKVAMPNKDGFVNKWPGDQR